ncbi:MAG: Abi-alpha family protein [Legionella sp.]|uniref:Abi-alpha family protein n=1 Tax=Legionella sp. TaxID=459 RepID=UPI0028498439|nr:Abi-alpha family protein [Legionella sp.]
MGWDEKAVVEISEILKILIKEPLAEAGQLLTDQIKYWRWQNKIKILQKANKFLESRDIDPKSLPEPFPYEIVIPLLEASGEATDDTISTMFSNLLADSLDPVTSRLIHPSYGKVLNQLAPIDVRILVGLFSETSVFIEQIKQGNIPKKYNKELQAHRQVRYYEQSLIDVWKLSPEVVRISLENIKRLGICDEGHWAARIDRKPFLCLTDYGFSFIGKCMQHDVTNHEEKILKMLRE